MQNFTFEIGVPKIIRANPVVLPSGNPGLIGPPPGWSVSPNAGGILLTPAGDGLTCAFTGVNPGVYTVTVTAAVPGGATIADSFIATVNQQPATNFLFTEV